jgi:hypothetical protein
MRRKWHQQVPGITAPLPNGLFDGIEPLPATEDLNSSVCTHKSRV